MFSVVRPAVRACAFRSSVNSYFAWCDMFSLSGAVSLKLATCKYSSCEWPLLKRFSRSEVKGQCHSETKCTFQMRQEFFRCWTVNLELCACCITWQRYLTCTVWDFWRHFGLCRAAAHSDCFFAPCTNIFTYVLTYLLFRLWGHFDNVALRWGSFV